MKYDPQILNEDSISHLLYVLLLREYSLEQQPSNYGPRVGYGPQGLIIRSLEAFFLWNK